MATLADLSLILNLRCRRRIKGRRPPPLILLTDEARLPDPLAIAGKLPAGSLVILRHYDAAHRETLGIKLAKLCRAKRLTLLVAGDPVLAQKLKVGLHLPEYWLKKPLPAIRLIGKRQLLTAACHSRTAMIRARTAGAKALLLSPVLPTQSHPGAKGLGILGFRRLVRRCSLPVYALGGVNAQTIGLLTGSGAAGAAGIGGFL